MGIDSEFESPLAVKYALAFARAYLFLKRSAGGLLDEIEQHCLDAQWVVGELDCAAV